MGFQRSKNSPERIKLFAKVCYRALVKYPQFTPLPCSIKGCMSKKRNGRCGLEECHLKLDENDELTGECLMFKPNEPGNRKVGIQCKPPK